MQKQTEQSKQNLENRLFEKLRAEFQLSDEQMAKVRHFCDLLLEESKKQNLTGYRTLSDVLSGLFSDSMVAANHIDFKSLSSICDVGTGAGFPGLALKILFGHLKVFLIEVKHKKVKFLERVISELELDGVEVVELDWRTFNRQTNFDIDLFVSKAAFGELEICRMFRRNCNYNDKKFVYWTSQNWECQKPVQDHLGDVIDYRHRGKNLRLATFQDILSN